MAPHNPLGADILVAKKMSEMLAERINGIVGPCLEVGQSKSLTLLLSSRNGPLTIKSMAQN